MVKIHPARTCLGSSLLVGMEMICLLTLIVCCALVANCSSELTMSIAEVMISPHMQVTAASWAIVGIPITLAAGVGALYRIEWNLRLFFWYYLVSWVLACCLPAWLIISGQSCLSKPMTCRASNAVLGFWFTFLLLVFAWLVFMVWSAAEECNAASFPELVKYAQRSLGQPQEAGRPAGMPPSQQPPMPSYGGASPATGRAGQPPSRGGPGPQSFVPAPGSGFSSK